MRKNILLFLVICTISISGCKKDAAVVKGCMDPLSTNYNPNAKEDDGSCSYLASPSASNKKALLEDFTGVRCVWCPCGHLSTEDYIKSNQGKLVVIATQTAESSYNVPYSKQEDLRTSFALALENNAKVGGFPAGTINRRSFGDADQAPYYIQTNGGYAMTLTAGGWTTAANEVTAEIAPVNIGIKTSFDASSRVLTATVETYYTSAISEELYMNVAITEDSLKVGQIRWNLICDDANSYLVDYNYIHNHVLRTYVTGQWGEQITTAKTKGTRTQKIFTYTLPSAWKPANCKIVVFVSEEKKNVLNVAEVKLAN